MDNREVDVREVRRQEEEKALAHMRKETPFGMRRSVLQDWVQTLTFMQQAVLLCALRGPDGIRKDHPCKVLLRWYRRSILIAAFERRALTDPYEGGGGSFTGVCKSPEVEGLDQAAKLYLRFVDELPHHFQLHFMHGAEILGYKHPLSFHREWWGRFYLSIVNDAHLNAETETQLDYRLGDYEAHWREKEEAPAL